MRSSVSSFSSSLLAEPDHLNITRSSVDAPESAVAEDKQDEKAETGLISIFSSLFAPVFSGAQPSGAQPSGAQPSGAHLSGAHPNGEASIAPVHDCVGRLASVAAASRVSVNDASERSSAAPLP